MRLVKYTAIVRVVRVLLILAGAFLVIGILVRQMSFIDRQMIYFPDQELVSTPADVGLVYEDVDFTATDRTKLHGWYVPGDSRTTLLWFHGNAGNISHRVDNILMLNRTLGVNIMIIDYRGYGRSQGSPSENGLYMDAEAAFEFLVSQKGVDSETELVLFGRSLGAAVAAELAVRHEVRGVILESGFTSVKDMAQRIYPFLPMGLLINAVEARYDTISKIGNVNAPVMVLHGDRDEIVPFELGEELFEAASEPKTFYRIRGAGHNDTYHVGGESYFEALREFVSQSP
jgi:fermentation-respiration switch protein FrsA (DUF1100 family)